MPIWKNAITNDPKLKTIIARLPNVVYSTKKMDSTSEVESISTKPEGVLVYMRTADDYDALTWIDKVAKSVTESQFAILRAAECEPDTPA